MTHEQAYSFMLNILKHMVLSEDYQSFKKIGVNANDFPKDIQDQVKDFERVANKNLSLAKIKYSAKFNDLPGDYKKLTLTQVADNYFASAKVVRCYEFLENIRRQPIDAERIAMEFLRRKTSSVVLHDLKQCVEPVIMQIEDKIKNGTFEIIISGWERLSKTVGGFNAGCVFVFTAKTGVGKTNLALNIAASALKTMNVLYFNMEMLLEDIVKRIFMSCGHATRKDIATGDFYKNKSQIFQEWYSKTIGNENKFLISDGRSLSIDEITSTIVKENEKNKIGLVVIDYDQKIKTPEMSDQWRELHKAVEQIEEIAKFCELPIIILAQGDDDGAIKASKRITQSATAQFDFYYDENVKDENKGTVGGFVLEAKKNRHGIFGKKILVNYNKELCLCTEGDYYNQEAAQMMAAKNAKY